MASTSLSSSNQPQQVTSEQQISTSARKRSTVNQKHQKQSQNGSNNNSENQENRSRNRGLFSCGGGDQKCVVQ